MASGDTIFTASFRPASIEWDARMVSTSVNLKGIDGASSNLNFGSASLVLNGGDAPPYGMGWSDGASEIQPGKQYLITITEA